tara:strand:- start:11899 stop:13851 length:1953 start_codon:yes stop_codon:yes gene_type:complete
MGRERSSLVLLKLSPADQALYDAEMQSLQRPDPEFDWGGSIQRYRDAQMKLTDFDPDMMGGSESGMTFGDFYDQFREPSSSGSHFPLEPGLWQTLPDSRYHQQKVPEPAFIAPKPEPEPSGQTILGQFHPRWPNPHDKSWVEGSDERPMGAVRMTPTHTEGDKQWIDPKTGKTKTGQVLIRPRLLTEGHPVLHQSRDNIQFERGTGSSKREFPTENKPGFFATGPSLSDIASITTDHGWGNRPNMVGIRGKPQDEDVWIRSPDEAPETLHELYYMEHQPASKLTDPFSLIPGRREAQRMLAEHGGERHQGFDWREDKSEQWGFGLDKKHWIASLAGQMSQSPIPALSAGLDREGKPMILNLDEIEEAMYRSFGEHTYGINANGEDIGGINHVTEMISRMQHPRKGHSIKGEHPDRYEITRDPSDIDDTYRGNYDIDIKDALHIPSMYTKEDTQHGIHTGDMEQYQKALFKILGEKYDIPHNLFRQHMKSEYSIDEAQGSSVAANRFMFNAAKASGWDFHPSQHVPYPRDEHGWPMSHRNEQMSGNALKLLFGDKEEDNYGRSEKIREYQSQLGSSRRSVRNPFFGPEGEEKITQPPTKNEWREIQGHASEPYTFDEDLRDYREHGLTPEFEQALIALRQRKKGGIGNETV